jgi:hypothetical protein
MGHIFTWNNIHTYIVYTSYLFLQFKTAPVTDRSNSKGEYEIMEMQQFLKTLFFLYCKF